MQVWTYGSKDVGLKFELALLASEAETEAVAEKVWRTEEPKVNKSPWQLRSFA